MAEQGKPRNLARALGIVGMGQANETIIIALRKGGTTPNGVDPSQTRKAFSNQAVNAHLRRSGILIELQKPIVIRYSQKPTASPLSQRPTDRLIHSLLTIQSVRRGREMAIAF
jgi:hypothetical protein